MHACGFRIYFTPLPGFFSPFPHGTGSLSVDYEYLALEDGPPIFRQDFTCPALLRLALVPPPSFRIRGYHPLGPDFPDRSASSTAKNERLLRVRSPLLPESRLISVPPPTEMFQFSGFAPTALCIQAAVTHTQLALPFDHPRSLQQEALLRALHVRAKAPARFSRRRFCAHFTCARKLPLASAGGAFARTSRARESQLSVGRVSPFGHLRINARLPAPRSFSQAATSFIACNRQGIHLMHFVA